MEWVRKVGTLLPLSVISDFVSHEFHSHLKTTYFWLTQEFWCFDVFINLHESDRPDSEKLSYYQTF